MTKASLDNRDKQTMIKFAEFTVAGMDTLCSNKSAMRALSPERRWRNIMSYTALWWGFEAKEDSRWQQRPR
jgi:hypothetical protein